MNAAGRMAMRAGAAAAMITAVAAFTGCGGRGEPGAGSTGSRPPPTSATVPAGPSTAPAPAAHPSPSAPFTAGPGPSRGSGPARRGPAAITGRLAGTDWTYIPTSRHVVALTFDAGANADAVAPILATLQREHVPATFFLTGAFTRDYPDAARAIAAAGFRIGDHTITHPHLTQLTDAAARHEILGGARQIAAVTGANPAPLFRFPFGDTSTHAIALANQLGYVPVRWTVDTLGWEGKAGHISAAVVVSRVLAALRPGEIVLMHVGANPDDRTTFDADALPRIITGLRARGYSFVTMDALVG